MSRVFDEYKGVIVFFVVLVVMASLLNNRVRELNNLESTKTIAYYEQ